LPTTIVAEKAVINTHKTREVQLEQEYSADLERERERGGAPSTKAAAWLAVQPWARTPHPQGLRVRECEGCSKPDGVDAKFNVACKVENEFR